MRKLTPLSGVPLRKNDSHPVHKVKITMEVVREGINKYANNPINKSMQNAKYLKLVVLGYWYLFSAR